VHMYGTVDCKVAIKAIFFGLIKNLEE